MTKLGVTTWSIPDRPGIARAELLGQWLSSVGVEGVQADLRDVREGVGARADVVGVAVNEACDLPLDDRSLPDLLVEAVTYAARCRSELVYVPAFDMGRPKTRAELSILIATLRRGARLAGEHGIRMCLESPFDVSTCLHVSSEVGPDLWHMVDVQNCALFGVDPLELLNAGLPIAPQVHVKDGEEGVMGNHRLFASTSNIRTMLGDLRESISVEWMHLENDYQVLGYEGFRADVDTLRRMVEDTE